MNMIKDMIDRWKILANQFLKEDKRVYIKDIYDSYYFADILFVGQDSIEIQCFEPVDKVNKKFKLYWANISKFKEYVEKEE